MTVARVRRREERGREEAVEGTRSVRGASDGAFGFSEVRSAAQREGVLLCVSPLYVGFLFCRSCMSFLFSLHRSLFPFCSSSSTHNLLPFCASLLLYLFASWFPVIHSHYFHLGFNASSSILLLLFLCVSTLFLHSYESRSFVLLSTFFRFQCLSFLLPVLPPLSFFLLPSFPSFHTSFLLSFLMSPPEASNRNQNVLLVCYHKAQCT